MTTPDRNRVRRTLSTFDARRQKIAGGMIAVMIGNAERVRDREWICQQFTEIVQMTNEVEDEADPQAVVSELQAFVRDNIDAVLNACFELFLCVAEDMSAQTDASPTQSAAVARAMTYFHSETPEGDCS